MKLGEIIDSVPFLKSLSLNSECQAVVILVEFALWLAGGRWEGSLVEHLLCAENQMGQFLRGPCEVGVVIHISRADLRRL